MRVISRAGGRTWDEKENPNTNKRIGVIRKTLDYKVSINIRNSCPTYADDLQYRRIHSFWIL